MNNVEGSGVRWRHRVAARQDYYLQGWRRQRVYPDFVACRKADGKLLILETKGIHLKGGEDMDYKKKLLATLEEAYSTALERGNMKAGEPSATFRTMFEDNWKGQVNELVVPYERRQRGTGYKRFGPPTQVSSPLTTSLWHVILVLTVQKPHCCSAP